MFVKRLLFFQQTFDKQRFVVTRVIIICTECTDTELNTRNRMNSILLSMDVVYQRLCVCARVFACVCVRARDCVCLRAFVCACTCVCVRALETR